MSEGFAYVITTEAELIATDIDTTHRQRTYPCFARKLNLLLKALITHQLFSRSAD